MRQLFKNTRQKQKGLLSFELHNQYIVYQIDHESLDLKPQFLENYRVVHNNLPMRSK